MKIEPTSQCGRREIYVLSRRITDVSPCEIRETAAKCCLVAAAVVAVTAEIVLTQFCCMIALLMTSHVMHSSCKRYCNVS